MHYTLKNEHLELIFDKSSKLISYQKLSTKSIIMPHSLCRIILGKPDYDEFEAVPDSSPAIRVDPSGLAIVFEWTSMHGEDGEEYSIRVALDVALEGESVRWGYRLVNMAQDVTVREMHYPLFSVETPERVRLTKGEYLSMDYGSLASYVDEAFTAYVASDQKYVRRTSAYPGFTALGSVNFWLLERDGAVFYCGCHDSSFLLTGHAAERETRTGSVNCFMERFPFLASGCEYAENNIVTAFVSDWTDGCALYRKWADTWYKPPEVPVHLRRMAGWQRIIMRHQFGEVYYRYNDLVKMYEDGKAAGLDTLFLFGWTAEGMDAGYPAYTPDETQGGFEALKKTSGRYARAAVT